MEFGAHGKESRCECGRCCSANEQVTVCGSATLRICEDGQCHAGCDDGSMALASGDGRVCVGQDANTQCTFRFGDAQMEGDCACGGECCSPAEVCADDLRFCADGLCRDVSCQVRSPQVDVAALFNTRSVIDAHIPVSESSLDCPYVDAHFCAALETESNALLSPSCRFELHGTWFGNATAFSAVCHCGHCCLSDPSIDLCGGFLHLCDDGMCRSINTLPSLECRLVSQPIIII